MATQGVHLELLRDAPDPVARELAARRREDAERYRRDERRDRIFLALCAIATVAWVAFLTASFLLLQEHVG